MQARNDWATRLSERVTVEYRESSSDGQGGQVFSWEALADVWAEVLPVSMGSRERASGQQAEAAAGYRVRIRKRADVNATMRLQWRGRTLAIHSLHEHDEMLDLLTYEEGV